MPDDVAAAGSDEGSEPRNNTSASTTKVTVAFPFSRINVHEPSEALVELARILADLAEKVAAAGPGTDAEDTARAARALLVRLRS